MERLVPRGQKLRLIGYTAVLNQGTISSADVKIPDHIIVNLDFLSSNQCHIASPSEYVTNGNVKTPTHNTDDKYQQYEEDGKLLFKKLDFVGSFRSKLENCKTMKKLTSNPTDCFIGYPAKFDTKDYLFDEIKDKHRYQHKYKQFYNFALLDGAGGTGKTFQTVNDLAYEGPL